MVSLLDVNVLVALFDPAHVHHEQAHDWFADTHREGWATCPTTESGFVRFMTRNAQGRDLRVKDATDYLRQFCRSREHVFWPEDISLRDDTLFNLSFVQGHRQLTDVFLLGLAKKMSGRLVTFDGAIPCRAVVGATEETLQVISPVE